MVYFITSSKKQIIFLIFWLFSVAVFAKEDNDLTLSQRPEAYGRSLCHQPGFHCVNVEPGDTWEKRFPNIGQRDIVQRLNRTTVLLKYRRWLIVPETWNYMNLGPFASKIDPPGQKLLLVDLGVFAFAAYDADGRLMYWGPATGGDEWCSDSADSCKTAEGVFNIYRMKGADCVSNQYPLESKGGAHMPYCMYYYQGYAIHGDDLIGFTHRSHGCVHVFYEDAKWLQEDFVALGTAVIVRAS